jgi:hypothetical protein
MDDIDRAFVRELRRKRRADNIIAAVMLPLLFVLICGALLGSCVLEVAVYGAALDWLTR